jgi:hypothetical protein
MTWEIVAGLIAICGAAVSLGTVLARLVRTLTRLDVTLATLDKTIGEDRRINSEERADMRARINAHEGRITKLEWREGVK